MPHIQNKIIFWESKPKKEIPVKHLKNSQGSPPLHLTCCSPL